MENSGVTGLYFPDLLYLYKGERSEVMLEVLLGRFDVFGSRREVVDSSSKPRGEKAHMRHVREVQDSPAFDG